MTTNIVSCHTGLQTTAYTCYDNKHCELPYRITDNSLYMLWQQTLWVAIQDYRQQPIHVMTTNIVSCHTGLQTTAYTCYDNKHCELPYSIIDNSLYMLWQQTLWVAIQDYRQQPIHVMTTNIVSCHTGLQTTAYTCYDNKHCELPYRITDNSLYMLWQQTLWVAIQDYRQQPIHAMTTNIVSCHTGLQTTAYTCYDNKHCELPYRITDNSLYMLWQQTLWVAIQDYRQQPIHVMTTNIVSCHTGLQTTAYACYDNKHCELPYRITDNSLYMLWS